MKTITLTLTAVLILQNALLACPEAQFALRAKAFIERGGEETAAEHIERIKEMSLQNFRKLDPQTQDNELIFLHRTREEIPALGEAAERELMRLFSNELLDRLQDTYLDGKHWTQMERIKTFYNTYHRFQNDLERVQNIGRTLADAPFVRSVYGTGYPFYGNVHIPLIIFFMLIQVARGQINQDTFIRNIVPDIDLIVVFEPPDPIRENPARVQPGMSGVLFTNFIDEMSRYRDKWKALFEEVFADENVADTVLGKADPVKEFMEHNRINLDIVPYREYVWQNLPAFVAEEDSQYFEWITDLFFTGDPIKAPAGEEEADVPMLFRRNFLLRMLDKPMTEKEIFDRIFTLHGRRLYARIFSQVRQTGERHLRQTTFNALEGGLIVIDAEGRLRRTELGTRFIQEVLNQRAGLVKRGLDNPRFAYNERALLHRARTAMSIKSSVEIVQQLDALRHDFFKITPGATPQVEVLFSMLPLNADSGYFVGKPFGIAAAHDDLTIVLPQGHFYGDHVVRGEIKGEIMNLSKDSPITLELPLPSREYRAIKGLLRERDAQVASYAINDLIMSARLLIKGGIPPKKRLILKGSEDVIDILAVLFGEWTPSRFDTLGALANLPLLDTRGRRRPRKESPYIKPAGPLASSVLRVRALNERFKFELKEIL
jgi:hypothetical protein